jgi:transposase
MNVNPEYSVGMDIHKKTISYCFRRPDGKIAKEGSCNATAKELLAVFDECKYSCVVGVEATMFTSWIYDTLLGHGIDVYAGHPAALKAIYAGKKKSDKIDARKLANLLRCDLFPECYMAPKNLRQLRRVLRFRNSLVHTATRMKNQAACMLMELGISYNKKKLHGKKYFKSLVDELTEIPDSIRELLLLNHENLQVFQQQQKWLLKKLQSHPDIMERVQRLMTIPGVGPVTALTWVLEVGEPERFSRVKAAVSYCGLCSAQIESAGITKRAPISKQRNKHLQTILIEAAKLAPKYNPQLAAVHKRELERGKNKNQATIAVARKLVAYMLCVDKSGEDFELRETE